VYALISERNESFLILVVLYALPGTDSESAGPLFLGPQAGVTYFVACLTL